MIAGSLFSCTSPCPIHWNRITKISELAIKRLPDRFFRRGDGALSALPRSSRPAFRLRCGAARALEVWRGRHRLRPPSVASAAEPRALFTFDGLTVSGPPLTKTGQIGRETAHANQAHLCSDRADGRRALRDHISACAADAPKIAVDLTTLTSPFWTAYNKYLVSEAKTQGVDLWNRSTPSLTQPNRSPG